jgi:hypothetical protein
MEVFELQTLPRHGGLPAPERDASTGSRRGGAPESSKQEISSLRPENGNSRRSESDGLKRSEQPCLQKPQPKYYGFCPPMCPKSDAEVSQWILEAEREDRRLNAAKREEADQLECEVQSPWPAVVRGSALRHRGCSFRLPTSKPIAIPRLPYDPLNLRWMHQEQRRKCGLIEKKVPKKGRKSVRALAKDGFDVQIPDDYDSDVDVYDENGKLQCPICDRPPEPKDEELEIGMDVTPPGDDTAATIIVTDTMTIITSSAGEKTDIQKTGINFLYEVR